MGQFNDISTIRSWPRLQFFIGNVRSLYYRLVRWNVWVFRRSFSVFVQYIRRVLKNVDNGQVRKPAICDVFVCKHWKEIVGLSLGELEGNRENFPSWAGKRDCGCLPLTIVFWKLLWKVSGACLFGPLQLGTTGHLKRYSSVFLDRMLKTEIRDSSRVLAQVLARVLARYISTLSLYKFCSQWKLVLNFIVDKSLKHSL